MRAQPVTWPVRSGPLPPLAAYYHPRPESGIPASGIIEAGVTTVLVPPGDAQPGLGGTGKTLLAASAAHAVLAAGGSVLVAWVNASSQASVLTGYAQAALDFGAASPDDDPLLAAQRFLAWLAATDRPWLVVLDDLAAAETLAQLWPSGPAGQVLVTARAADPGLAGPRRRMVTVGAFSRREALSFLSSRLSYPDQRIGALDLAEDLGFQPLAMAMAAAQLADTGTGCREYRADISKRLGELAFSGDQPPAVTACWMLAAGRADQLAPSGLAWPVLVLAAMLDPNGIPAAVLTSPTACEYVTGQPAGDLAAAQRLVRAAVANLARLCLVSVDPDDPARTVRVHPVVQAGVRDYLPPQELQRAALAAAAATLEAWPARDVPPLLGQALRDGVARLVSITGDLLWADGNHPVLVRAGRSLAEAGLHQEAIGYWQQMISATQRILGPGHAVTLLARENLAAAFEAAGRPEEAIRLYAAALAEREQAAGPGHPDTLALRGSLAHAYHTAGRTAEAVSLYEQTLAEQDRVLGPTHPDTLALRASLAAALDQAGRTEQAIAVHERVLTDCERLLGPAHATTLTARASLAAAYHAAGQMKEAIAEYRRTLADRERAQGPGHPDTLAARGKLAYAYRLAGRMREAFPEYRRVLADRERIQGPDHPDTLTARGNLASACHTAGRVREAIPLYERNVAGWERVRGADHPDTLTARGNLASAYHTAGRLADAIPLYEQVAADYERVLGRSHPDTLTCRANLAHAYYAARRLAEAIAMFERTLAECEQVLGSRHPTTEAVRESLQAIRG